MSVRKRTWVNGTGEHTGWIVDYKDGAGKRRHKTFELKRDADAFHAKVLMEVKDGTHVAESATVTVREACDLWLATCGANGLEEGTLEQYDQHARLHIKPFIGALKLSKLSVTSVRAFEDKLREEGRSPPMVKGIVRSLGSVIADAQERGLIGRNPVREMSRSRKGRGKSNGRRKLELGKDIPDAKEIRTILRHTKGQLARVTILTFATTGLRASELRGLRWSDLDLNDKNPVLHVRQRANHKNKIGAPKSKSGTRTIPLSPTTASGLRHWKKSCPRNLDGELHYVFPTEKGKVQNIRNIGVRIWQRSQIAAGLTRPNLDKQGKPKLDKKGRPILKAKYLGLHPLRHFFASWCINSKAHGGLGLDAKDVQERMGHSSIQVTFDVYGHLFERKSDTSELAKAEKTLLG